MKQLILVVLWCFLVSGVIPKAEKKAEYEAFANQSKFDCVGQFLINGKQIGSCVLIAENWVISAAHNLEKEDIKTVSVLLLGKTYAIEKHFIHPKYNRKDVDLALMKLVEVVENCTPAKLYTGKNELGKTSEIVGWGTYGTAFNPSIDSTVKIGGTNVIEQIGGKIKAANTRASKNLLLTDFETTELPRSNSIRNMQPTALEYSGNGGDSGCGLFIEENGERFLAGIYVETFFIFKFKIDPSKQFFIADEEDIKGIGLFGSIDGFTRISTQQKWINSVMEKN